MLKKYEVIRATEDALIGTDFKVNIYQEMVFNEESGREELGNFQDITRTLSLGQHDGYIVVIRNDSKVVSFHIDNAGEFRWKANSGYAPKGFVHRFLNGLGFWSNVA
jgi:hypothetical protein